MNPGSATSKFDQVRALIEAFLAVYPDAAGGYAFVVLKYHNLGNFFLDDAEAAYQKLVRSEWNSEIDDATHHLLQILRIIPEDKRRLPEDDPA